MGVENAATNGKQKWTKSYSIRASESARMRTGRGNGWPRPRRPFDTDAEYIATPSGHQAAITFIKQMIDSPSTTN